MTHSIKLQLKSIDQLQSIENRFDRSKFNVYSNSAYRNAKQRELMMREVQEKTNANQHHRF